MENLNVLSWFWNRLSNFRHETYSLAEFECETVQTDSTIPYSFNSVQWCQHITLSVDSVRTVSHTNSAKLGFKKNASESTDDVQVFDESV